MASISGRIDFGRPWRTLGFHILRICCLGWLWWPVFGGADPLDRFKLTEPIQFRYQETRHLVLLAKPWYGEGFLLADTDGTLVKLQLIPRRIIMAATPSELLYYDPGRNERRHLALPSTWPQVQAIILLQQLLRGHFETVRRSYRIDSQKTGDGWRIILCPRKEGPFREVIFKEEQDAKRLDVVDSNGDRSTTILMRDEQGPHLRVSIARLLQQVRGL